MPYDAYPEKTDIDTFLTETGLPIPANLNTAAAIASAVATWENKTRWRPFLAAPSVRSFDAPGPVYRGGSFYALSGGGRYLDLNGGLLTLNSLTVAGMAFTVETMFWPKPLNAPAQGLPWTWIEFLAPAFCQSGQLVIDGVWGRCEQIPDDVWNMLIQNAAIICAPRIAMALTQGALSITAADESSVKFDKNALSAQVDQWSNDAKQLLKDYVRRSI